MHMHMVSSIIIITITISLAALFFIPGIQNSLSQVDNTANWTKAESDKLIFKYPNNWKVNVSNNQFDDYEVQFRDPSTNASILVSNEVINDRYNLFKNYPEGYFDFYKMNLFSGYQAENIRKIETYPKGNVSIAGIPAYSELYLNVEKQNVGLISLAFQEGNERHYTVLSTSPEPYYDELEPTMLKIIKSITPKTKVKHLQ